MDAAQIEKLKALALAANYAAAELSAWPNVHQIADGITMSPIANYVAGCRPATVLELIAENKRLRAEKEQAAQDAFALAWDQALSDAGFYVAGHCANGEHHAEIIMEMIAPKLTINGAQSMVERVEELAVSAARQTGSASQVGCERDDGLLNIHAESETCEVCSASAAVADKDAARLNWIDQRIADKGSVWILPSGAEMQFVQLRHAGHTTNYPTALGKVREAIDAAIGAHTKAETEKGPT